jgi:soluble lytic murein transglycosylase
VASPEEIENFRRQNPHWPGVTLRARAEEALLTDAEPERILAFFQGGKPETGAGKAAMAVAILARGDLKKATALAVDTWRNEKLSDDAEVAVLTRLDRVLTPADHKYRADRILYADTQFDGVRALRISAVNRLLPKLGDTDRAKIAARLAVYRCGSGKGCLANARKLMAKLPLEAQKDWGIFFAKALMLRKSGAAQQAWRTMLQATTDPKQAIDLDQWWDERRANAYAALYARDYQAAYRLAAEHGPLSVNPGKEAEFIAGWIALRFLKDPKRAIVHFTNMRGIADGPVSLAQSQYWLGRSYSQGGNAKAATPHYVEAAKYFNTYYGQIARQTLDKTSTGMAVPELPKPSAGLIKTFVNDDATRALVIASKADLIDIMRAFIGDRKDRMQSEDEGALVAHLALTLGDTQMAVKVGKTALERGYFGLTHYAYPTVAIPAFEPLRPLTEPALTYAIARQESEFNTLIKSPVGARGILQIMPATAKGVCKQYKLTCEVGKLTADPSYNARLATAYAADITEDFRGSYIMGIAAYNAGPGRVRQWIDKIGDPREPGVDPVDWVEMLHLDETRDYVKKVLSNVQVYRAELEDPAKALRIRTDLLRGRAGPATAAN